MLVSKLILKQVAVAAALSAIWVAPALAQEPPTAGPPAGKYVCRQYMTTINYHSLDGAGAYEVAGVNGEYGYDPSTGEVIWESGSYASWEYAGLYEQSDGEHIIRLTDPTGALKIDCFLIADQ